MLIMNNETYIYIIIQYKVSKKTILRQVVYTYTEYIAKSSVTKFT